MKLTEELKQKINDYFESKSEFEVYGILKSYGIDIPCKYNVDERPVGEEFEFIGKKLKVVKSKDSSCLGCCFNIAGDCRYQNSKGLGACDMRNRSDKNYVIFVEVWTKKRPTL